MKNKTDNYRWINTYCIMNCDIRLYKGSFRPKRQNEKPILQIKYESIKHKHNCTTIEYVFVKPVFIIPIIYIVVIL
jgi:hypothetical protein